MQISIIWIYFAIGAAAGVFASLIVSVLFCRAKTGQLKTVFLEQMRIRENINSDFKISYKELEDRALKQNDRIIELEREVGQLSIRLEDERQNSAQKVQQLLYAKESMTKEFKLLAAQVMEENGKRFGSLSKERVEQVVKPLQLQMESFKQRVDELHIEDVKSRAILGKEILMLKNLNQKIGEDAVNLTNALKGSSKQQGIWGEMVLSRVLEASGLRENEEYEKEVTMQDGDAKRFRPDVVVHLPDHRDIIIDAKTSLNAYEKYANATNDTDRSIFAAQHLSAVKQHIERLAKKSYSNLEGINTLDFIFMFMPIEGALMLALQTDGSLYDKAFEKHIVLVSPTTLLVALRAVENTWRYARQNQNALEIARRAGALYDKFAGFAEDLERVGKQLDGVQKTYDGAWKKLTQGRGNVVRQIERLREMGARNSRQMPKKLADEADLQ